MARHSKKFYPRQSFKVWFKLSVGQGLGATKSFFYSKHSMHFQGSNNTLKVLGWLAKESIKGKVLCKIKLGINLHHCTTLCTKYIELILALGIDTLDLLFFVI